MTTFYSALTGGFYVSAIHGDSIPADAVEITEAQHVALLEGQSQGFVIVADSEGHPNLQSPPSPTHEQLAERVRRQRDHLLAESDWTQLHDVRSLMALEIAAEWGAYRQALRDAPAQPGFPASVEWPVKPTTASS